jgi:hypothetical protein
MTTLLLMLLALALGFAVGHWQGVKAGRRSVFDAMGIPRDGNTYRVTSVGFSKVK